MLFRPYPFYTYIIQPDFHPTCPFPIDASKGWCHFNQCSIRFFHQFRPYSDLWGKTYSPLCGLFPTDITLYTSRYYIDISIANSQTSFNATSWELYSHDPYCSVHRFASTYFLGIPLQEGSHTLKKNFLCVPSGSGRTWPSTTSYEQ